MARRDRQSHDPDDSDDGSLLFGSDHDSEPPTSRPRPRPSSGPANAGASRVEKLHHARDHRRRRVFGIVAVALVIVLGATVYFVGLPVYRYLFPKDYTGSGSGSVVVTVRANDGADQIGATLARRGVVGSVRAFTDAASSNSRSQSIQPGSYRLHLHMSGVQALDLLLNPSSRLNSDTVVTEGATIVDVEKRLIAPTCTSGPITPTTICGLGISEAKVKAALANVQALGLPTDYLNGGKQPLSVEGFLYPATYTFDDTTSATDALQQMVGKFTDQARAMQFTAGAKALGLTPYDALIIASIAQGEAKYAADMPKVARVIMNRLQVNKPLQVDATSAYAAKLKGLDPTKEIYAQTAGPYNSYTNPGLPPTPIGNPGMEAMQAAVQPAAGNWLFYVNADAAGHLFFTNSEAEFVKAAATCRQNNWGCG